MAKKTITLFLEKRGCVTNGDVIKALFLHKDIEIDEHKNYTQMYYTDSYITFPSSWWNRPYKAGDTDGNKINNT